MGLYTYMKSPEPPLLMDSKSKKRKVEEENGEFNSMCTDLFVFTTNAAGLEQNRIAYRYAQTAAGLQPKLN